MRKVRRGSLAALPRFRDDELDVLRICERHGWTYAQWYALPEEEQIDRLAFQHNRDELLGAMYETLTERIDEGKPVELSAYISVLMQRFAA